MPFNKNTSERETEPQNGSAPVPKKVPLKQVFVLHRHLAHQLHYDLRLCIDDVLKSWAIPKGPSMNSKDKRLALQEADHPYAYKDFKGIITEGYGAGIVEIWDKGKLLLPEGIEEEPNKYFRKCMKKGEIAFLLKGRKLKGAFVLVRTERLGKTAWLLLKKHDAFSTEQPYDIEQHVSKNSTINRWLKNHQPPYLPEASSKPKYKKQIWSK